MPHGSSLGLLLLKITFPLEIILINSVSLIESILDFNINSLDTILSRTLALGP